MVQRLYLFMAIMTLILFGGLTLTAVRIGSQQPTQEGLDGFREDCAGRAQPCWNGIVPGQTSLADAQQLIPWNQTASESSAAETRYYLDFPNAPSICRVIVDALANIISWVEIEYCDSTPMHIGDVVAALGLPARILGADREMGYGGDSTNDFGWWSPFDHASAVNLVSTGSTPAPSAWFGFIPKWRYCQIRAIPAGC